MKLDNMIADGIENTLDERLLQYTADLKKHHFSAAYKIRRHLYDPCRWDRKRHGSSLSDE